MKVTILINSLAQGGAERVASTLANHSINDDECDIDIVLIENDIFYKLDDSINISFLSSLTGKDSIIKKTAMIPIFAYRVLKHIKRSKPDIIVSFLYHPDFTNVIASYFHKKPIILSQRVNSSSYYNHKSAVSTLTKFLIKRLYPKAPLVINVSEGTKKDLVDNFGVSEDKQIVIYNPYDSSKIEELSKEPIDLKLDRDKTIIAVSRFRPIKNIQMILRAFKTLNDDISLVIVGSGQEEAYLKDLTKELELEDRVYFVGERQNPYSYMSKASIYVSSSRSEGFPNALVEAMICGCAIVSTDCPSGPREILDPSSNPFDYLKSGIEYAQFGTLVAVDEIESLSNALKELLNNTQKREDYSKKAKLRAKDFRLDSVYDKYKKAFKSLIKEV
jgi:N-acetylgalactosamine-N,N'-diacetylbacillosaminyl-diphospho-undecaprenol 4-alpha-N-acetylgalactosaminyltransferase